MKKFLSLLTIGFVSVFCLNGCASSGVELRNRHSAVRITTVTGVCSATIVAPKTILSASHCFRSIGKQILIGEQEVTIERIYSDGNDHALVVISGLTFSTPSSFGKAPVQGDKIHYWGNPFGFDMLLRRGYITGFDDRKTLIDVNGYKGDSGAGVFDQDGNLVAVISYITIVDSFSLMGAFPFNFTKDQLRGAGLNPIPYLMTGVNISKEIH